MKIKTTIAPKPSTTVKAAEENIAMTKRIKGFQYATKTKYPAHFGILNWAWIVLLVLGLTYFSFPQNSVVPPGNAPGTSPGSYLLSNVETISLFSGRVTAAVPLVKVGGRGNAGYSMMYPIKDSKWTTYVQPDIPFAVLALHDVDTFWGTSRKILTRPYEVGTVALRYTNRDPHGCLYQGNGDLPQCFTQSALTIVFTSADGTEHALYDEKRGGLESVGGGPYPSEAFSPGRDRGFVFSAKDGSGWTFIGDPEEENQTDYYAEPYFDPLLTWNSPWSLPGFPEFAERAATGYLKNADGTTIRFENARAQWIQDRNGNKTTFEYHTSGPNNTKLDKVTDSNGRVTDIVYGSGYDEIVYKGTAGESRTIKINQSLMQYRFAPGNTLKTIAQLFPEPPDDFDNGSATFNPTVVSTIEMPDESEYNFYYNSYGELARMESPTGAGVEYTYGAGLPDTYPTTVHASGLIGSLERDPYHTPEWYAFSADAKIYRRLLERREYANGGSTATLKTTYSKYQGTGTSGDYGTGKIREEQIDPSNDAVLLRSDHHFYGDPIAPLFDSGPSVGLDTVQPLAGREYMTENVNTASSLVLSRTEYEWNPGCRAARTTCGTGAVPEPWSPFVESLTTSIYETSTEDYLVKKTEFQYDKYNNLTDTLEYDFGVNEPGTTFLRRTHTDYLTATDYVDHSEAHLRSLPSQIWMSSDSSGNDIVSRIQFEYDNYSSASEHPQHDPLVSRSSVIGHDSTNYGSGFIYRGNVTAVTKFANADAEAGAVTAHSFFDILGNLVKTRDARGKETSIFYADNFGSADDEAQTNTVPSYENEEEVTIYPLGGLNTFAFATSTTNPMNWTGYVQYDYFTGKPVNVQDVNGMKLKTIYDDLLDRPTQSVVALTTASERQTTIDYDDSNRQVTVTSDLNALDDNLLKTVNIYDRLGRIKENRTYEADGGYRAVETQFDPLGRPYKVSNPFRSGDTQYWTESKFDALGRPIQVETLDDNAKIIAAYDGNRTIITDQAGKQRISLTNALGQLTDIWEIRPSSDGSTVSVTFPGGTYSGIAYGYKTSYGYDILGNLTGVDQGSVDRGFTYDSLSRLLTANNPESGEVQYDYDNNGNVIERTDARGIVTTFTYDDLNRVTAKAYATPSPSPTASPTPAPFQDTPSVAYTYDNLTNSKGYLTKVETSVSTTEYTEFDILGRVTKSKQTTDGTIYGNGSTDSYMTYSYNLAGMLIEQQYPSGRKVQNVLDNDGQLEMVKSRKNASSGYWAYANNFTYSAAGAIKSMQLGNGMWESTVYNNRLQPTQIALGTVKDGYDRLKLNYSYGDWVTGSIVASKNNGNIVQQIITVPNSLGETDGFTATQKYYYDSLNRIDDSVETISGETWQQDFEYDRYGNRNFVEANTDFNGFDKLCTGSMCSALKKRMNPAIGADNRLSTSDNYRFDDAGNTIEDPDNRQFIYDGENKQVEVLDDADELIGQYWYDGDGRRVKKVAPPAGGNPGEITVFVYDAFGKQIAEYSVNIESINAKVAYLTSDHLGSPRINTDKNGGVTSRHDYHPFGEEIITNDRDEHAEYTVNKVRKQFTGYERDKETDLDFAQARYFNYGHGRFSSPDPFGGRLLGPQSLNKYSYVGNNPLVFVDPSGLECREADRNANGDNCIWVSNGKGLYESLWQSHFKQGNDLFDQGYKIIDPSKVEPFRMGSIGNNDANPNNTSNLASLRGELVTLGHDPEVQGQFVLHDEEVITVDTSEERGFSVGITIGLSADAGIGYIGAGGEISLSGMLFITTRGVRYHEYFEYGGAYHAFGSCGGIPAQDGCPTFLGANAGASAGPTI